MPTVNEEIQDRTIRHMVYLERYKASEVRKIVKELNTVILPDIEAKIAARLEKITQRGTDLGVTTTARLNQLEKELRKLADDLSKGLKDINLVDFNDLTEAELIWQAETIKKSLKFNLETVLPAAPAVARIIKKTSFAGLTLDQWYDSLSRSTQKNVMIAVNRGIVEGETTEQIVRRIKGTKKLGYTDGVWETTRAQASTITRSVINHVSTQSRLEFFKDNEDIIAGLKWISTLDSRTSATCASLDGKVFPIDEGPRPPVHPNCRSTMTAVLKDIDLPEGTRSSEIGPVPESTTYGEWLKRQAAATQDEILGPTRAQLFRKGNLPVERFVGSDLKPLNLKQLRKIENDAFKKAGI